MNQYLLLRDNKQSGPYSVEELIKKGLKPYDLVWLDGKSAAWRYPSEVAELKAFAPAVEEQPYDRFYKKKPTPQTTSSAAYQTISTQDAVTAEHIVVTKPVIAAVTTPAITAKKIYVTLPAGVKDRPQAATHTAVQTQTEAVDDTIHDASEQEAVNASLLNEKFARLREEKIKQAEIMAATPVVSNKTAPDIATIGFSEIVEKNHRRYEEKLATAAAQPRNNNRLLMRSIVAACLLLCGVIIGLAISNSRQQKSNDALDQLVKQIQERDKRLTAANPSQPPAVQEPTNTSEDNTASLAADQPATSPPPAATGQTKEGTATRKNNQPVPKESPPALDEPSSTIKVIPAVVTSKQEEKPLNKQELEQARRNIHQLVAVDANKYKTGVLGGISNLVLTVSNNSLYPLDQVEVEIRYLGPEKRVVKTQLLVFNDVAAGEQKTIEAPRTNRGVTVDYLITRINSKALGLAHVGN